ncbi:hypothetical protein H310_03665 [Aphanomyces invadans]|uniref:Uncharacterized protein n=1 Tax=Aphanomyces invadans TaxID=157072 RepID=A0A024UIQ5_9STRA|nr:hypothetical protein H310_03665 [Aphanomyces invadans]ETW06070.1 hypothetical protein H310_03665 [Aphanomyces invadans]|eukprot:XP_008865847.1 hypothetical protein H310_03665 [Aphanomyces invadans]
MAAAAAEHDRHVRVQRALEQVNGISISRIYNEALAEKKAKKTASAQSFEERIEAIITKTQEIAQRIQLSHRRSLDDFDAVEIEDDDDDDESADGFTIMDDDAQASRSFKRQLSRFLSLPRSLSKREMEEITDMVLHEVNNTPDHSILMHEIGSLIDEHVLTPRDGNDGDASASALHDDDRHRGSLSQRRQKDIPKLDINPPSAVDMAQRQIYKSANKLNSISFRGGFDDSHAKGLTRLSSKATMLSLFGPNESMASMTRSPTSRGSPKATSRLMRTSSKAELDAAEAAAKEAAWRAQVKEDYVMWLRAKSEAAAAKVQARKDERALRKKKKPRWLLLYEQGRLQRQHLDEQIQQLEEPGK